MWCRMQLVVMVTVLALVGAEQGCRSRCHLTEVRIPVESCGITEWINTSICLGQCYHEDSPYISPTGREEQKVCNGDWSYEVMHIKGCPVGVRYPVVRNCRCTECNPENAYCGHFHGHVSSCVSF
uniref:Glycoprotein hormone subunit beta domain-containing protein n=1 Tax=Sander lucioperca TaxID=283035 RepID=A0A8C9ZF01_SANLU